MKKILLLAAFCAFSVSVQAQSKKNKVFEIDPAYIINADDFEAKIQKIKGETVIDLRPTTEYSFSHLDAAVNIPYDAATFEENASSIDKTKPVFLYSSKKSDQKVTTQAMLVFLKAGVEKVYYLEGGFDSWNKKHKPIFIQSSEPSGTGF